MSAPRAGGFWLQSEAKDAAPDRSYYPSSLGTDAAGSYAALRQQPQSQQQQQQGVAAMQPYDSVSQRSYSPYTPSSQYQPVAATKPAREQSWFLPTHSRSPLSRGVTSVRGNDDGDEWQDRGAAFSAPPYQDDVASAAAAGYGAALRRASERRERTGVDDATMMGRDERQHRDDRAPPSAPRRTPSTGPSSRLREASRLDASPITPLGHMNGYGDPDTGVRRRSGSPTSHTPVRAGGDGSGGGGVSLAALAASSDGPHHRDEAIWILTGEVAALTTDIAKKDVIISRLKYVALGGCPCVRVRERWCVRVPCLCLKRGQHSVCSYPLSWSCVVLLCV